MKTLTVTALFVVWVVWLSGCAHEEVKANAYKEMYATYVTATANKTQQGASATICSLSIPRGGMLPEGFKLDCNMPLGIVGAQTAAIQPPQYPPSPMVDAWERFGSTLVKAGLAGVLGWKTMDAIENISSNAGGNVSGSYNTSNAATSTKSGTFDSYNGDYRDFVNDRHDYVTTDRHDVINPAPVVPIVPVIQ